MMTCASFWHISDTVLEDLCLETVDNVIDITQRTLVFSKVKKLNVLVQSVVKSLERF